jgi:DNA polymerase II small subunit/DNA polymerase delta subunit B
MFNLLVWQKIWVWLKNYWYVPVILIAIVVTAIVTGGKVGNLLKLLKSSQTSYEDQIRVLNESHQKELEEREKLNKKYQEVIANLEKEFAAKSTELTEKEKKEVEKLTKTYNDDPQELSKIISERFGISYVQ